MRQIVFTSGCFYLITPTHVNLIERIRNIFNENDYKLIIGINDVNTQYKLKGYPVIFNNHHRVKILSNIKGVDEVVIFYEDTPSELVKGLQPHYIVKGIDYDDKKIPESKYAKCGVIYLKADDIYNISTSYIVKKLRG